MRARKADPNQPRRIRAQHLAEEERKRLPVRGHRHLPIDRQPGQERPDLGRAHPARIAQAVVAREGSHPVDIGLLN